MSFRIGLSGLNAASQDLSVTGNNIANASTTGFKRSRAEFVDVYAASYQGISRLASGNGVRTSQIQQQMNEGNIEYTDNNLDLAISGKGFFTVSDQGAEKYTRAGQFSPDDEGYVVNGRDQRLQVFPPNGDGTFNTGQLQDLRLSTEEGEPAPTTTSEVGLNLNADNDVPPVATFDPDETESYNYSTSQTVYDSLGSQHEMRMYFRKVSDNTWDVYTQMADGEVTNPGADQYDPNGDLTEFPGVQQARRLEFTDNGDLDETTSDGGGVMDYDFSFNNGSADLNPIQVDFSGATQYAKDSATNRLNQDGYASGLLTGISINDQGVALANYTNGDSQELGQIALSNFSNPQGLQPDGDTAWTESSDSGEPLLGQPGTSNLGLIQSGAVEASNVDLAEELTSLITAQRNYQANSKTIQTQDTITQTLINLR
ncbi:flagellar hook protein FlgE [Thiohalospira halophila DSM 15071]|uniref:Flagellar hook protein FlgE n=1 Tax=Thiohalospira halophila DSM 15071 TaxID=1123397 RepID=A0A1I1WBG3_9GAMM|nr:flagellar hook protein FlgE [Thiohalospira halophila]SFD92526.1 flagellar hook protein FlgE [Thiohalospira halophila DSM 15071]